MSFQLAIFSNISNGACILVRLYALNLSCFLCHFSHVLGSPFIGVPQELHLPDVMRGLVSVEVRMNLVFFP